MGTEARARQYRSFVPSGVFDARVTYQSAFDADKPPSEAELARERARQRAAAAGLPPPPAAAAAPVAAVSAEPLPPAGRQSRLPPPPMTRIKVCCCADNSPDSAQRRDQVLGASRLIIPFLPDHSVTF